MSFGGILPMGVFQPYGQPGSFQDLAMQQQDYVKYKLYSGMMQAVGLPTNILKAPDKPKRSEPSEFQWLRNRVNEILWR